MLDTDMERCSRIQDYDKEPIACGPVTSEADSIFHVFCTRPIQQGGSDWFPATITAKHANGKYSVRYTDGDLEKVCIGALRSPWNA